jgi:hypothetical protein
MVVGKAEIVTSNLAESINICCNPTVNPAEGWSSGSGRE